MEEEKTSTRETAEEERGVVGRTKRYVLQAEGGGGGEGGERISTGSAALGLARFETETTVCPGLVQERHLQDVSRCLMPACSAGRSMLGSRVPSFSSLITGLN